MLLLHGSTVVQILPTLQRNVLALQGALTWKILRNALNVVILYGPTTEIDSRSPFFSALPQLTLTLSVAQAYQMLPVFHSDLYLKLQNF